MTPLSIGEFCQFNLKSRLSLLHKDGSFLGVVNIAEYECKLFYLYGFFVELVYDSTSEEVVNIWPITSYNLLSLYA